MVSSIEIPAEAPERLQAVAFWRRWRAGRRPAPSEAGKTIPGKADLPPVAWRHYRHFSWVIHEQRIAALILGFLFGACVLVWSMAWHLRRKPALVIRAAPSLKAAAEAYYGRPEIAYDQVAFFLQGCLPLLHAADESGHPLLPLAQGLVAPDLYRESERRLDAEAPAVAAHRMTEGLTLTGVDDVVTDEKSGRAAANVRGYLTVTVRRAAAQVFPWTARVLLSLNPPGRLNPYPFYLISCEESPGPQADPRESGPGRNRPSGR